MDRLNPTPEPLLLAQGYSSRKDSAEQPHEKSLNPKQEARLSLLKQRDFEIHISISGRQRQRTSDYIVSAKVLEVKECNA